MPRTTPRKMKEDRKLLAPKTAAPDLTSQPQDIPPPGTLVAVARIVRPQGVKGEVLAIMLTDFPERFAELKTVYLSNRSEPAKAGIIENYWHHKGRIVLKFCGIETRNQAEELRGLAVQIKDSDLMPLPEGTFYEFDLIGSEAVAASGEQLGRVKEIMRTGAAPVLVVESAQGREYLIPLAEEICTVIDVKAKKITVSPPDGLLDL